MRSNESDQPPRASQAKPLPIRKTEALLRGRVSLPGAAYFVTLCTQNRSAGLTNEPIARQLIQLWRELQQEEIFDLKCGTVMPDHLHMLLQLGEKLTLPQVVSRLKSKSKAVLNSAALSWQRNYYDHRLRNESRFESFALYIFLNPYRKALLEIDQPWPHWIINNHFKPQFCEYLIDGKSPQPEWLPKSDSIGSIIESDTQL